MFRAISTSVVQIYNISERNANPLTLVNTIIILHFSLFFNVYTYHEINRGNSSCILILSLKKESATGHLCPDGTLCRSNSHLHVE